MKINRVTAVCFSAIDERIGWWKSEKGAEAIAAACSGEFETIRLPWLGSRVEFSPQELVVFGIPINNRGQIHHSTATHFGRLKGNQTPCIITVTYAKRDHDNVLLELADMVKKLGFVPVGAAALVGIYTSEKGRPNAEDLAEDAEFGRKVMEKLAADDLSEPEIPGNRPYKEENGGKIYLLTAETCVKCGLCARECSEGAIDGESFEVNPEKCIACFRCAQSCPVLDKNMPPLAYREFADAFIQRLVEQKENRYFS